MKYMEKHPMMIVIGVLGVSLSAIFVKYSQAPAALTIGGGALILGGVLYYSRVEKGN